MAKLICFQNVSGEEAGFLLPVFQAHRGANHQLIQKIDSQNNVVSFDSVFLDNTIDFKESDEIETDIGKPAIWIFRDPRGIIHAGDWKKINFIGLKLLSAGELDASPMAASEMVFFCNEELRFRAVLREAFLELSALSTVGAETWRDTMILLPAIKQDVARQSTAVGRQAEEIHSILAVSDKGITHVYASALLNLEQKEFPTWKRLADIFDIHGMQIHHLHRRAKLPSRRLSLWSVLGVGGNARYIIKRAPFFGSLTGSGEMFGVAIARGPALPEENNSTAISRLLVGIVGSDLSQATLLNKGFQNLENDGLAPHVINIRPIGFGTASPRKASPAAIFQAIPNSHALWLIATHRLRQTGSYANSLSASHTACRVARAAARGLITCIQNNDLGYVLHDAAQHPGVGVAGASRYDSQFGVEELIKRVLYSMLNEDALLHTSRRIVLLWPYNIAGKKLAYSIKLGPYRYDVEIIYLFPSFRNPGIIGFATNVSISKKTPADFIDFCSSLLAGYGWNERHREGSQILIEAEGEVVYIDTASTPTSLREAVSRDRKNGSVILTNQTISRDMRKQMEAMNRKLLHYSEIERWMKTEYGARVFADW